MGNLDRGVTINRMALHRSSPPRGCTRSVRRSSFRDTGRKISRHCSLRNRGNKAEGIRRVESRGHTLEYSMGNPLLLGYKRLQLVLQLVLQPVQQPVQEEEEELVRDRLLGIPKIRLSPTA